MAATWPGARRQAELVQDGSLCVVSSVGGTTVDCILVVACNRWGRCWSGEVTAEGMDWESFRVKPRERELNQGDRGKRRGERAQGVLDRILGKNRRKTSHRRQKRDWSMRRETERTSQKPMLGLFKAQERSEASSTMESHRGRGLNCFGNWGGGVNRSNARG